MVNNMEKKNVNGIIQQRKTT